MNEQMFGNRLKALMHLRKLSQGQLAKKAHISQARLSGIMNGKGGSVGIDIVEKLCYALKVTPNYLIGFPVFDIDSDEHEAETSARTGLSLETVEALSFDAVPYFAEFLTAGVVRDAEWLLSGIANDASRLCAYRESKEFKEYMIVAGIPAEDYEKEFDDSTWGAVHKLEMLLRNRIEEFAQAYLTHQGQKSDQLIHGGRNHGNNPQENK